MHSGAWTAACAPSPSGSGWPISSRTSRGPDRAEHPDRIPAEDLRDLRVGIAAPDQPFGQVEDALRVVEATDVDRAVAVLVILIPREVRLRARIEPAAVHRVRVADDVEVAADRDVLETDELRDVVHVIEHVL